MRRGAQLAQWNESCFKGDGSNLFDSTMQCARTSRVILCIDVEREFVGIYVAGVVVQMCDLVRYSLEFEIGWKAIQRSSLVAIQSSVFLFLLSKFLGQFFQHFSNRLHNDAMILFLLQPRDYHYSNNTFNPANSYGPIFSVSKI